MKLLILPCLLALVLITGASRPGSFRDAIAELLSSRDELPRDRAEIADLRHGRGAAAPGWLEKYAHAICVHDAEYVLTYTDPAAGLQLDDVTSQFEAMHAAGQDCATVRYLGSVNGQQFIFVLRQGKRDVTYVFTLSSDGKSVANVE